mgnify:CR=1 FL=1
MEIKNKALFKNQCYINGEWVNSNNNYGNRLSYIVNKTQHFGNEIFERVPAWYRARANGCLPVMTDLGRLILVREALGSGAKTVFWIDADIFIFDPDELRVEIDAEYAFSRELWVQPSARGFKIYRNVHNAFCMFRQGNPFLDFYIHACLSIMQRVDGGVPNQIVGTKLLTAIHNIIGFPLMEQVGMASPLVLENLIGERCY